MKKRNIIVVALAVLMMAGCSITGTSGLGGILNGVDGASVIGNVLGGLLGTNKVTEQTLVGTWKYASPGCAFTSQNVLAQAGGEVAAQKVESQLATSFSSLGINSSNTYFTFNQDQTFSGKLAGRTFSGTYVLDSNTGQIALKTLLLNMNGYVTLNTTGLSLLFESQKLLTVLQAVGAASGNATLSTIGELSKNYDGVRIGFDLSR